MKLISNQVARVQKRIVWMKIDVMELLDEIEGIIWFDVQIV